LTRPLAFGTDFCLAFLHGSNQGLGQNASFLWCVPTPLHTLHFFRCTKWLEGALVVLGFSAIFVPCRNGHFDSACVAPHANLGLDAAFFVNDKTKFVSNDGQPWNWIREETFGVGIKL
jgi:hypothetical protein